MTARAPLPILYSFRRCPCAMRARMALDVSGQTCAPREILLKDKPAEMIAVSPKATVPVPVLPDGAVLDLGFDNGRREWGLISHNPISDIRKPASPPPRDRRVLEDEIGRLLDVAGADLAKASARAVHAFRFAVETAMRAGEIVGLAAETVDRDTRVATLPKTKNGTARKVPLSTAALELPGCTAGK